MAEIKLRCETCGTPIATLQNGCLVIKSRHHGEEHVNTISVWQLVLMALREITKEEGGGMAPEH